MCDLVVASETASSASRGEDRIIPGAGGTQRWARTVGKVRAMGGGCSPREPVRAVDAERMGLVNACAAARSSKRPSAWHS